MEVEQPPPLVDSSIAALHPPDSAPTNPPGQPTAEDGPSSFSRIPTSPDEPSAEDAAQAQTPGGTASSTSPSSKKTKKGTGPRPKAADSDPVDQEAVARANLAAAPFVGVVGYGPGTGGGSGIRRHTPSCDFCKRRKERCIGGPPCQTCSNRDIPCTFRTVNKAHFDRKRAKNSSGPSTKQEGDGSNDPDADGEGTNDAGPSPNAETGEPSEPAEPKAPRIFKKRGKVSEIACVFCRERRKKCSAEKPTCTNCHRRGVECVYPDTPRARKGGRKRKDGSAALPSTGSGQSSSTHPVEPTMTGFPLAQLQPMPGMLMPMPFLSPSPCHFCRDQDTACDRLFPGCSNCHRRGQQCFYDAFTPDITQLGVWPAAMPLPPLNPAAIAGLANPQMPNPSPIAQQAAIMAATATGQLPYYDVSWLAHWVDMQQNQGQPLATMFAVPLPMAQLAAAPTPAPAVAGSSSTAEKTVPAAGTGTIQPQMIFPQMFDHAVAAAAFAQAQAQMFAQAQPQPQTAAAAVAQTEAIIERSSNPNKPAASEAEDKDDTDGDVPMSSSQEQPGEDADGEDDDDLDLDQLDATIVEKD